MTHHIHETAAIQRGGIGRILPVRILDNDGTTARVQAQATGLYLTQGQTYTVPSDQIRTKP
jgi:hypothetical protein